MGTDGVEKEDKKADLFRDTPVRYLGYANEVGEAFRSLVPGWTVGLSYAIASGYVLADTAHKSRETSRGQDWRSGEERRAAVGRRAMDTLVWQGLASVAVPGFTINRLCKVTAWLLRRQGKLPPALQGWATTAVGLAAIPFIIRPIDAGVHIAMDATLRPTLGLPPHYPPSSPPSPPPPHSSF